MRENQLGQRGSNCFQESAVFHQIKVRIDGILYRRQNLIAAQNALAVQTRRFRQPDPAFDGTFRLQTGSGADTVTIGTLSDDTVTFGGPVQIGLGGGDDSLTLGSSSSSGAVNFLSTAVVNGQAGSNTLIAFVGEGSPQFKHFTVA